MYFFHEILDTAYSFIWLTGSGDLRAIIAEDFSIEEGSISCDLGRDDFIPCDDRLIVLDETSVILYEIRERLIQGDASSGIYLIECTGSYDGSDCRDDTPRLDSFEYLSLIDHGSLRITL